MVSNWQELRDYLLSLGPISPSGFGLASRDFPWRQGRRRLRGGGGAVHGSLFFPSLNWISHHSNLGLEPGMDWELAFAFQPPGFWKAMLAEFESRGKNTWKKSVSPVLLSNLPVRSTGYELTQTHCSDWPCVCHGRTYELYLNRSWHETLFVLLNDVWK